MQRQIRLILSIDTFWSCELTRDILYSDRSTARDDNCLRIYIKIIKLIIGPKTFTTSKKLLILILILIIVRNIEAT